MKLKRYRQKENVDEIKRKYIKARSEFWKSEDAPFKFDDKFETLMEYVDSRVSEVDFQESLKILGLKGGEKILDLGASTCWASYAFSRMGCNAVALDLDMDCVIGLMAGKRIIENSGIIFSLVNGDCEQMPLKDKCFDVVFCSQVLHHAEDLNKMVNEASRVTKPGGIIIAISEVKRGLFQSEKRRKVLHKAVTYGVNEHFPLYYQYVRAFIKSGMSSIVVLPTEGWDRLESEFDKVVNLKRRIYKFIGKIPFGIRIMRRVYLELYGCNITILARKPDTKL